MALTVAEKIELAMIPFTGFIMCLGASWLPSQISLGRLLLYAFALFLFQGLIRDLDLLAKQKVTRKHASQPLQKAPCICLESTIGVAGIIAGIMVLFSNNNHLVYLNYWQWIGLVMFTVTCGFLAKDYVLEWWPLKVKRDKGHINLAFSWRKK